MGGYTVEALARSGVGHFVLVDDDKVCLTNINRQIIATRSSVGKYKVDVMKERILDINPKAEVEVYKCFYLPENADDFDFSKYSYVVDAVDTVTAKIEIIMRAKACNVPVISCMGAGNKLDPTKFRVADIYKTNMCPLAKVMRREMKKRGVKKLKVVYSEEKSLRPLEDMSISCRTNCICPPGAARKCTERRDIPGSVAFVPSVAGLILAGEVIKDRSFRCQRETAAAVKNKNKRDEPRKSSCAFRGSPYVYGDLKFEKLHYGNNIIFGAAFGERNQISFYCGSVYREGRNTFLPVLRILEGDVIPCTAEVSADLELFHIGRNTRI